MAFFKGYMYNMTKGENVAFNIHGLFCILMFINVMLHYDISQGLCCILTSFFKNANNVHDVTQ